MYKDFKFFIAISFLNLASSIMLAMELSHHATPLAQQYITSNKKSCLNIKHLLENDGNFLKELIKKEKTKGYCKKLHTAESVLSTMLNTPLFNQYCQETQAIARTIANRSTARNQIITAIQNRDLPNFYALVSLNPEALNAYSPECQEGTIIHLITQQELEEYLTLAIKYNANLNTRDKYQRTPLFDAAIKKNKSLMKLLIQNNAFLHLKDYKANTVLHYLLDIPTQFLEYTIHQELLNLCLEKDQLLINECNEDNNTPLHQALINNISLTILQALLTNKFINLNIKNSNNQTIEDLIEKKFTNDNKKILMQAIMSIKEAKQTCDCTKKYT